jgi:hypothetical protein
MSDSGDDIKWLVFNHYKTESDTAVFDTKEEAEQYRAEWLEIALTGIPEIMHSNIIKSQFKIYRCIINNDKTDKV